MSLVKVKNKYQIVIPEDVRGKLKVKVGDMLEVMEKNGRLIIKPVIVVDKSQEFFWTSEWQEGEKEAEEDIRRDRLSGPFETADKLIRHLKKSK